MLSKINYRQNDTGWITSAVENRIVGDYRVLFAEWKSHGIRIGLNMREITATYHQTNSRSLGKSERYISQINNNLGWLTGYKRFGLTPAIPETTADTAYCDAGDGAAFLFKTKLGRKVGVRSTAGNVEIQFDRADDR